MLTIGDQKLSGLSERVGGSGHCGVNSRVGPSWGMWKAFWLIQHLEFSATVCERNYSDWLQTSASRHKKRNIYHPLGVVFSKFFTSALYLAQVKAQGQTMAIPANLRTFSRAEMLMNPSSRIIRNGRTKKCYLSIRVITCHTCTDRTVVLFSLTAAEKAQVSSQSLS